MELLEMPDKYLLVGREQETGIFFLALAFSNCQEEHIKILLT